MSQTKEQKAISIMRKETKRAVAHVERLEKLYLNLHKKKSKQKV